MAPTAPLPMPAPASAARPVAAHLSEFVFRKGEPMIWLTGAGLAVSLLMIFGLLGLVGWKGLGFFWPRPLVRIETADGRKILGDILSTEKMPAEAGQAVESRIRVKIGNRDLNGLDFRWIPLADITKRDTPKDALLLERQEYGNFHGFLREIRRGEEAVAGGDEKGLQLLSVLQQDLRSRFVDLNEKERKDVGAINALLEKERLRLRKAELAGASDLPAVRIATEARIAELRKRYESERERLETTRRDTSMTSAVFADAAGREKTILMRGIVRIVRPNDLSWAGKASVYSSRIWEFVSGEPRESNTEGGIFPAIFGTVLMVVMMSLVSVPFGVVAALYLREYAVQGRVVRLVRIAVNNLAGVPSIVFGIFGLGFFVYGIGARLDELLFAEALPTPTFGTGGILWCALTLALLTVPVVVVATEEALAAVPAGMRHASLALGATRWQTVRRVVLPAAAPGILTGLILAMARGTGEVAPLMIVGVVKLAPTLPVDGVFPYLHLDRKIMHLGFHLFDVGFQSPNVEAAIPMVYSTTILLLLIVVALNLTAILVRNYLRRRLFSSAF